MRAYGEGVWQAVCTSNAAVPSHKPGNGDATRLHGAAGDGGVTAYDHVASRGLVVLVSFATAPTACR